MVTKDRSDIDFQGSHGPEPLLVNKSLCCRRHSMYAAVAGAAFFTQLEIQARLDQRCEQTTGFELHDACRHCLGSSRNKVERVPEIRYLNWTARPQFRTYFPCVFIDVKIRFRFQVVDDWTKLLVAARTAE